MLRFLLTWWAKHYARYIACVWLVLMTSYYDDIPRVCWQTIWLTCATAVESCCRVLGRHHKHRPAMIKQEIASNTSVQIQTVKTLGTLSHAHTIIFPATMKRPIVGSKLDTTYSASWTADHHSDSCGWQPTEHPTTANWLYYIYYRGSRAFVWLLYCFTARTQLHTNIELESSLSLILTKKNILVAFAL